MDSRKKESRLDGWRSLDVCGGLGHSYMESLQSAESS